MPPPRSLLLAIVTIFAILVTMSCLNLFENLVLHEFVDVHASIQLARIVKLKRQDFSRVSDQLSLAKAVRFGGKDAGWLLGQGMEACAELGINVYPEHLNVNTSNQCDCCESDRPEQISVFKTESPTGVIVQWVMRNYDVSKAQLRWWVQSSITTMHVGNDVTPPALVRQVQGTILSPSKWYAASNWVLDSICGFCGGPGAYGGYIYQVRVEGLPVGEPIHYVVGMGNQESQENSLSIRKAAVSQPGESTHTVVVGDIGVRGGKPTWMAVSELMKSGKFDGLLAVGDISYHNGYAKVYDQFFRLMQSLRVFTSVPVFTAPGNHENAYNFAAYLDRFPQPRPSIPEPNDRPGKGFYDVKNGNIHWISLNFESKAQDLKPNMIPIEDAQPLSPAEFDWLRATLRHVQTTRKAGEWLIVFAHRPLYCSSALCNPTAQFVGKSAGCNVKKLALPCSTTSQSIRSATYSPDKMTIEDLFVQYGVGVYIGAHVHSYERTYPVYHGQVTDQPVQTSSTVCTFNGDSYPQNLTDMRCVRDAAVFKSPKAPVYITNGAGGAAVEQSDIAFVEPKPAWSQADRSKPFEAENHNCLVA